MTEPDDPIIRQLREAISDNDRKLMETLNKRLELVGEAEALQGPARASASSIPSARSGS